MFVKLENVIEVIKNYGKKAIDRGRKKLDTVDDIIALIKEVEETSSLPSDEKGYERFCERFCDGYCKFPYICKTEDALESKCENCPICQMAEEVQKLEVKAREEFAEKLLSCYEDFDEKNEIITPENLKKAVIDTLKELEGDRNVDTSDKA